MHLYVEKRRITIWFYSLIVLFSSININPISSFRHNMTLIGVLLTPYFLYRYIYKPSKPALCLFGLFAVDAIFTILSGNMVFSVIYMFTQIILFIIWNDLMCKEFPDLYLDILSLFLSVVYLIQIITQIYDQGMWGIARSGSYINFTITDNYLGYYYVPFMMIIVVRSVYKHQRISLFTWAMCTLCLVSVMRTEATSCLLGVGFYLFSLIYSSVIRRKDRGSTKKYFIAYLVAFILIVFVNVLNVFNNFLTTFLNHDATLAGRTNYMWPEAIAMILRRPLIAYGTQSGGKAMIIRISADFALHAAHNYFLTMLIEAGVTGLLFFILMLISVGKNIDATRVEFGNNIVLSFIISGLMALLMMFLTEGTLFDTLQYSTFFIAYYCYAFINQSNNEQAPRMG